MSNDGSIEKNTREALYLHLKGKKQLNMINGNIYLLKDDEIFQSMSFLRSYNRKA